ncbi:MAG TPA: hypothetical protein VGG06_18540 [Thermoanaerobaculia bacterium]|jgi:hypothetical protein
MRRKRLTFSLTFVLITAAGTAPAAPAALSYALERVAVAAGGLPVGGVGDGVILAQVFDGQCRKTALPSAIPAPPLAGRVDSAIVLEIAVAGCQAPAPPRVDCAWTIAGRPAPDASCRALASPPSSGEFSWIGWQGSRPVVLPAETGIFDFTLRCRIGAPGAAAVEEVLERALYVTYSDPLIAFSPPEVAWYERAACWAAGLGRDAAEDDVVRAIQDGIYAYGQRRWRYGFSDRVGSRVFRFPLLDRASGAMVVYELGEQIPTECFGNVVPFCKCGWQALLEPEGDCNFADCYIFSHVLQAMSGVMGVGGLRPVKVKGEDAAGFITRPAASLDPDFPGNVVCREVGACYPYYFSSHSLLLRDGVFYDATFNATYERAEDIIALSRKKTEEPVLSFIDSDFKLYLIKEHYGTWPFYFDHEIIKPDLRSSPVSFTGKVQFSPPSLAEGEVSRRLEATFEVEIIEAGDYVIQGHLLKGDVVVSAKSLAETPFPAVNHLSGGPGKYWVSLYFSGDDIYQSGIDGPYEVAAFVPVHGAEAVTMKAKTPLYDYRRFGEAAVEEGSISATLAEPAARSEDPAATEPVGVKVDFDVRREGRFWVEGRLAKDGRTLAYGGASAVRGSSSAEASVELQLVPRAGFERVPPPFELTVVIYDSQRKAVGSYFTRLDPAAPN